MPRRVYHSLAAPFPLGTNLLTLKVFAVVGCYLSHDARPPKRIDHRSGRSVYCFVAKADEVSAPRQKIVIELCLKICDRKNSVPGEQRTSSTGASHIQKKGRCVGCSTLFHCPVRAAWTVELNQ
jgi:hypothetical protein